MRFLRIASSLGFFILSGAAGAQQAPADSQNIENIANLMVRLCVGGGHVEALTGGGTGGADISLRSLDVKGHLASEVTVSKSSAEGVVKGIDNAMSQVAADEADKVRVCLQPVRERLLDIMLPAPKAAAPPSPPPTFESLFASSFTDLLNAEEKLTLHVKDPPSNWEDNVQVRFRLYYDFRSNAEFISIYIPSLHDVRFNIENMIKDIRDQVVTVRQKLHSGTIVGFGQTGRQYEESPVLVFAGRIYIFTLNPLNPVQIGDLVKWYQEKGLYLVVLGADYWTFHSSLTK
jgi:hypothetical protein